jgi:peptidoglycan/LPS O-acetylase OafA/YrhL
MTHAFNISDNHRYYGLDALRGLAIFCVMLFHFTYKIHDLYPQALPNIIQFPYGEFPVYIFFSLSGFMIIPSLKRYSEINFLKIRFIRLYPVFILGCFVTFLTLLMSPLMDSPVGIVGFLFNLTFFNSVFHFPCVDGAYWTLLYEIGFYGFCVLVIKICGEKIIRFMPLLLVITSLIFILFVRYVPSPIHYFLMITDYAHFFGLGVALYFIHTTRQWLNILYIIPIIGICLIAYYDDGLIGFIEILLIIILFSIATYKNIALNYITKPFIALGNISYALYIFHQMIGITIIAHLEQIGINANIATIVTMIIMVIVAYYVTYYYDMPIGKKLRHRFIKP